MPVEYRTEPEYWEYLDGEVHPKVSPRQRHAVVQTTLPSIIRVAAAGRGQVGTEWDIWLPDHENLTKFIPDVSFFSFERLREMGERDAEFPPCAPDIAAEVWSPGDNRAYLEKKISLYLSHGSLVVLDVDFLTRAIRVHDKNAIYVLREMERFAHPLVPWLAFDVREVFLDLDIPQK
jgi:Uma2 family endonuclease